MKKFFCFLVSFIMMFTVMIVSQSSADEANIQNAIQWIEAQQNIDGSWGASDDVKLLCTVEAVTALEALNQRIPAYYWGITWLENHSASNVDYQSRRILALASHGDNLQADLAQLQTAQALILPGNSGWGLTQEYQGTPLDSAMALLAYSELGVSPIEYNVQPALNYLKTAQLTGTDKGWPVALESSSDPLTTALVIDSLVNYTSLDSSLATPIANGVSSLAANVNSSSPVQLQALAALAYLASGYGSSAAPLLSSIAAAQLSNGSWSNDPYITAVAARAFAASNGVSAPCLPNTVYMPDPYLRAVVNVALAKNGMDALTQCDMANLTTLYAAGMGISDLTGIEWAVNLTYADLSNNNITDTSPLDELPSHPTVQLAGNPGYPDPSMPPGYLNPVSVPALSLPGLLFAFAALIGAVAFMSCRKRRYPMSKITSSTHGSTLSTLMMLMVLIALLLSMQTASAANKSAARSGGLTTGEVQKIQAIGQVVLTAKNNAPADPELEALRQRVKELQQAIITLDSPKLCIGNIPLSLKTDGAATSGTPPDNQDKEKQTDEEGQEERIEREERENTVRSVLNEVQKQRALVQAESQHDTGGHSLVKRNAAAKVEELENVVEEMLNSRPQERTEKLKALKERLEVKYRSQVAAPDTGEKTPTISTIVHHREQ
ncbi:MAG: hypothetical protein AB1649_06030 [Chloroflexota bacterium]